MPRLKNTFTPSYGTLMNKLIAAGKEETHINFAPYITTFYSNTFLHYVDNKNEEPRILGLAMIPGKHIVSLEIDEQSKSQGIKIESLSEANDSSTEPLPAT